MTRNCCFILMFCSVIPVSMAQKLTLDPAVDERTELIGIVFRLAGAEEYSGTRINQYSRAIDAWFRPYKDEEVIRLARLLYRKNGVSFDAVMSMAIHLEMIGGSFSLVKNVEAKSLDSRWGNDPAQFITLLNVFYRESAFHKFFSENRPLYSLTEQRFSETIRSIDLSWYGKFYGEQPKGSFNLILSLVNGGANYGVKIKRHDGSEDMFSIIGVWQKDSLDFPVFSPDEYNSTIIHEFNHSFSNHLVDQAYPEMSQASEAVFKLVKGKMESQAYNMPVIMQYETMVRASTILYFIDHNTGKPEMNKMILKEKHMNGFVWIDSLVGLLVRYRQARNRYPALKDFMPRVVSMVNSLNLADLQEDANCKCSARIDSFSIVNKSRKVAPGIKELTIYFNKPMSGSYGMSRVGGRNRHYPKIISVGWASLQKKALTVKMKLEPGTGYTIKFPSCFFQDERYCEMAETYLLNFKTMNKN
ncbi:MAG: DUF4932 domain-containing protein [Bacteroidota bacterium]